jgi:hypothetical protein
MSIPGIVEDTSVAFAAISTGSAHAKPLPTNTSWRRRTPEKRAANRRTLWRMSLEKITCRGPKVPLY